MPEIGDLFVRIRGDTSALQRSLGQVQGHMRGFNARTKTLGSGLQQMQRSSQQAAAAVGRVGRQTRQAGQQARTAASGFGELGAVFSGAFSAVAILGTLQRLGSLMAAFGRESVLAASNAEAAGRRFDVVFAGMSTTMREMLSELQTRLPLTVGELEAAAAAMQDLLVPMGFARRDAARMTTEFLGLAGALSEFAPGRTVEDALTALQAALRGSFEPLESFGVVLRAAEVEARAVELGLADASGEVDQMAKATAALDLALRKSADAQAAFNANIITSERALAEMNRQFRQLQETLGTAFEPALIKAAEAARENEEEINLLAKIITDRLTKAVNDSIGTWEKLFRVVGPGLAFLLRGIVDVEDAFRAAREEMELAARSDALKAWREDVDALAVSARSAVEAIAEYNRLRSEDEPVPRPRAPIFPDISEFRGTLGEQLQFFETRLETLRSQLLDFSNELARGLVEPTVEWWDTVIKAREEFEKIAAFIPRLRIEAFPAPPGEIVTPGLPAPGTGRVGRARQEDRDRDAAARRSAQQRVLLDNLLEGSFRSLSRAVEDTALGFGSLLENLTFALTDIGATFGRDFGADIGEALDLGGAFSELGPILGESIGAVAGGMLGQVLGDFFRSQARQLLPIEQLLKEQARFAQTGLTDQQRLAQSAIREWEEIIEFFRGTSDRLEFLPFWTKGLDLSLEDALGALENARSEFEKLTDTTENLTSAFTRAINIPNVFRSSLGRFEADIPGIGRASELSGLGQAVVSQQTTNYGGVTINLQAAPGEDVSALADRLETEIARRSRRGGSPTIGGVGIPRPRGRR